MIHQPLGGVRGQASDIEIEAKEIIRTLERVNRMMLTLPASRWRR